MTDLWQKLSPRERRLALAVVVLAIGMAGYLVAQPALARLQELDDRIDELHIRFLKYEYYLAQRERIARAFSMIAAEHSSTLTEEEIKDRLNEEIYRLTLMNPPSPGKAGTALASSGSQQVIEIPELRDGQLKDSGEGYREYQLEFRTREADIQNVALFLRRLHESPQVLRIESLELSRAWETDRLVAVIEVTRTVVDGLPQSPREESDEPKANLAQNPSFENWVADGKECWGWTLRGCTGSPDTKFTTHIARCLRAEATEEEGLLFQVQQLVGGETYRLSLDVTAFGPAQLRITTPGDTQPLDGAQELLPDGKPYRYSIQFTAPGPAGSKGELLVPYIAFQGKDSLIYVDNVILKSAEV